jgi:hypothetical protein
MGKLADLCSSLAAGFNFAAYRNLIPAHRGSNGFSDTAQWIFSELRQYQQRHAAAQQIIQVNDHFVTGAKQ